MRRHAVVRGAGDVFGFADLVLRHLAAELPEARPELLRVVEFSARIEVVGPVHLRRGAVLEPEAPGVLLLPRTRRAIEALLASASSPRTDMVPFVSAVSDGSVTLATATPRGVPVIGAPARGGRPTGPGPGGGAAPAGVVLGRSAAWRAADMHWLAPWRDGVQSVGMAVDGPACQCTFEEAAHLADTERSERTRPVTPTSFLVLAGATRAVDIDRLAAAGGRVGVLRYAESEQGAPLAPDAAPLMAPTPASVGTVEYVLVDELA